MVIFRPPLPEHFDKQLPVSLVFDSYTISPAKMAHIKPSPLKSDYDKAKTNGLNSRNIEKVDDSIDDEKGIILLGKI